MNVEIVREPGDKRAPDIVDDLCTTDACAIKRGQNYLDENGSGVKEYDLDVAPLDAMPAPGDLVGIQDSSLGQAFEGKVLGYMIVVSAMTDTAPLVVETTLQVERRMADE